MSRHHPIAATLILVWALLGNTAMSQEFAQSKLPQLAASFSRHGTPQPSMTASLMAKAPSDECFAGIGRPHVPINIDGSCPASTVQKVNQSYVWGMTQARGALWFGTGPNMLCQALEAYVGLSYPFRTDSLVCEFTRSSTGGDGRAPKIYRYDLATRAMSDVTPPDSAKTLGLRSAGALGDVVFLAGPAKAPAPGTVTMFAFDARAGTYLGSKTFTEYNDIRKWITLDGVLYAGVQRAGNGRGAILRWRGDCSDLWRFEEVADLSQSPGNIALYEGNRFAISTWNSLQAQKPAVTGLVLGPKIPRGGLTARHFDRRNWRAVFSYDRYEPDPLVALTYQGGDLRYFDGWLYWGSMHLPLLSWGMHQSRLGVDAAPDDADSLLGTWRAATLWRGRRLDSDAPQIELLYGERALPRYDFNSSTGEGSRSFIMTSTGWKPRFGSSGFGQATNLYVWEMAIANGSLFMSTLDLGFLLGTQAAQLPILPALVRNFPFDSYGTSGYGADIWRIDSSALPARLEDASGLGNPVNYGVRTMLPSWDGRRIYAGMANPFNLNPAGGWELRAMTPRRSPGFFCSGSGRVRCRRNARASIVRSLERRRPVQPECRPIS